MPHEEKKPGPPGKGIKGHLRQLLEQIVQINEEAVKRSQKLINEIDNFLKDRGV
jgi:hypothetical protein